MAIDSRRWLRTTAAAICVLSTAASLNGQSSASITAAALAIQTATRTPLPAAMLSAALTDARPDMRLTAARIVGVTHALALAPQLAQALQHEQDVDTAVEQIRSLLLLGNPESMAAAFAYARPGPVGNSFNRTASADEDGAADVSHGRSSCLGQRFAPG